MLKELEDALRPLIGGVVKDAAVLVWPSNEGKYRLSSDLFLSIENKTGQTINVIISTDPDGQTPSVSEGTQSIEYSYDAFDGLFSKWSEQKQNPVSPDYHQLGFRLVGSRKYGWLKGETIESVRIIAFSDDQAPTGIKISFSSKRSIYSVAGVSGNIILDSDDYPKDFFVCPVEEISVNDQSSNS
jgi:hypothetical protein